MNRNWLAQNALFSLRICICREMSAPTILAPIKISQNVIDRSQLNSIVVIEQNKYIRVTVTSEYTICVSEPKVSSAMMAKLVVCNLEKFVDSNNDIMKTPNTCKIVSNNNELYKDAMSGGGLHGKTYKRDHHRYTYKK